MGSSSDCAIVAGRELYALQLTRLASQAGWRVVLATSQAFDFAGSSKHVHAVVRLPRPEVDYSSWVLSLQLAVTKHGARVVIPAAEEVFYCEQARTILEAATQCKVFTPGSMHVLEQLHCKWEFQTTAREIAARHIEDEPKKGLEQIKLLPTRCFSAPNEFEAARHAVELEAGRCTSSIVKPCFSRGGVSTIVVKAGEAPMKAGGDVNGFDNFMKQHGSCVVQEFIDGDNLSTLSIAIDGVLRVHACYKVLFTTAESGFGPVRLSYESAPAMAFVRHLVSSLRYTGLIGFDFMETADGVVCPLECNPRATNALSFLQRDKMAILCFGRVLHDFLAWENPHAGGRTNEGVYTLRPGAMSCNLVVGMLQLQSKGRPLLAAVRRSEGDDVWDLRDPVPFFHAIVSALSLASAVAWGRWCIRACKSAEQKAVGVIVDF